MGLKWTLLLFVGALLTCGSCVDWMGGGNFTQENLTTIRAKINAFDLTAAYTTYTAFASALSDELNTLWAPAWNVIVVYFGDNKNHDAVLYGYGFNGHWFWLNGVKTTSGAYVSFVIWKDYNCVKWITLNPAITTSKTSFINSDYNALLSSIQAGSVSRSLADIWAVAQDIQAIVPTANTATIFQDKLAYSIVAAQTLSTYFFSKVCAKDYIIVNGLASDKFGSYGTALILQMRS